MSLVYTRGFFEPTVAIVPHAVDADKRVSDMSAEELLSLTRHKMLEAACYNESLSAAATHEDVYGCYDHLMSLAAARLQTELGAPSPLRCFPDRMSSVGTKQGRGFAGG